MSLPLEQSSDGMRMVPIGHCFFYIVFLFVQKKRRMRNFCELQRQATGALPTSRIQPWNHRRHQCRGRSSWGTTLRHQGSWPPIPRFAAAMDDESRWRPVYYDDDLPHRRLRSTRQGSSPIGWVLDTNTSVGAVDGIAGSVFWWRLGSCQPIARLTELVLVDQHGGLVADSMGTSLWSLQAVIIDNSDILKNWEFIIP
jgi:hypothetical protein